METNYGRTAKAISRASVEWQIAPDRSNVIYVVQRQVFIVPAIWAEFVHVFPVEVLPTMQCIHGENYGVPLWDHYGG